MTPAEHKALKQEMEDFRKRLDEGEDRFKKLEKSLEENTTLTKKIDKSTEEIRDALVAARVGTKLIKWIGALAIAAAAVYSFYYQVTHDGRLPHQ